MLTSNSLSCPLQYMLYTVGHFLLVSGRTDPHNAFEETTIWSLSNFSITGFDDLDLYSSLLIDDVNIKSGQLVNTMSLPLTKMRLFPSSRKSLRFPGVRWRQTDDGDICGSECSSLTQYDRETTRGKLWDELTFNGSRTTHFTPPLLI